MKASSIVGALAVATLAGTLGCVGGGAAGPSQPAVVFPSTEELARIPARKAVPEAFGADTATVDAWTFESVPIPDGATYDDASPWGDLLREQVGRTREPPRSRRPCSVRRGSSRAFT